MYFKYSLSTVKQYITNSRNAKQVSKGELSFFQIGTKILSGKFYGAHLLPTRQTFVPCYTVLKYFSSYIM